MRTDTQAIDTNILLRLAIGDVPEQKKRARELVLSGPTFHISTLAVTEAVFTMERNSSYEFSRERIASILETLLSSPCFSYDKALLDEVFPLYVNHPKLSFNDCVLSFETAKFGHEPIWTFDKKFATQSPVAKLA